MRRARLYKLLEMSKIIGHLEAALEQSETEVGPSLRVQCKARIAELEAVLAQAVQDEAD